MQLTRRQSTHALATLLAGSSAAKVLAKPAATETMVSFGLAPDLMNNVLVRIQLENSEVCGFIATMDGNHYVLTNTKLISGHDRFTLATLSGTELRPSRIELSTTRDLARIQVQSDKGLDIAAGVPNGTSVVLADFSSPGRNFAELGGTIENANEERFDVSAGLGPEHCGCPILTADAKVCGLVSNIDYYKDKGTSWGNTARLFSYRIEDSAWFAPNWKQYDKQFGRPLRDADEFREMIYGLATEWMGNLKSEIETDQDVGLDVQRWIKQHNGMVSNLGQKRSKKGGSDPRAAFQKDFSDSCKALVDICSSKANTLSFVAEQKNASPFSSNQFKWRARELMQFVKFIKAFEEKNENYRW
ncbi:hypothetical protein PDESU_05173 [Pontiella desulfatans]|uniref:Uncharacterized protein n=1 Tax=Pontiella desulfatans TaxID=2750659 RepID=A0A6C2U8Z2_PONDE|nr:S1C family serine protease [Pontiella desulfatans]VGO16582.1 hypothetical protein PDESU_05173 [Pontiella desulfatans]